MEFIKELIRFLIERKKWWLAPILVLLLIIGLIIIFANSAIAPFIYTLFQNEENIYISQKVYNDCQQYHCNGIADNCLRLSNYSVLYIHEGEEVWLDRKRSYVYFKRQVQHVVTTMGYSYQFATVKYGASLQAELAQYLICRRRRTYIPPSVPSQKLFAVQILHYTLNMSIHHSLLTSSALKKLNI